MFDRKKLEHFLNSLQVETHFPDHTPKKIIVDTAPHSSVLDRLMDRYDIFKQADDGYENAGTTEFPVLAPRDAFNSPMYMPMQWSGFATYGGINRMSAYTFGIEAASEAPSIPVETAHDRLKAKLSRLAEAPAIQSIEPKSPPAPSRSPDFVHTITAWRGWEVTGSELESLGNNSRWEPRRAPRATCRGVADHDAPHRACHCGYWSFRTLDLLTEALNTYAARVDVIGQVEIWGRVIECENGWRSEFAYPKELWLLGDGLESLSWRYGVPARSLT